MRKLLFLLPFLALGCAHSQVPPTSHSVALSWTAPAASGGWAGCTATQPCTYVISRITVTGTTCPPANVATPNYSPLNQASPVTATSYTDTTATGLTACYLAQTEQGSSVSQPSNTVGPFTVPANPLAPSLTGTEAVMTAPLVPSGNAAAPILTASLKTGK